MLVTRIEHEHDWIDESVNAWLSGPYGDAAVIDGPGAQHGFETVDHADVGREAVRDAVRWVVDGITQGPVRSERYV